MFRIPLRHGAPLRYDFMTKLRNMLPEALEVSEAPCVLRQCSILLNETLENLAHDFAKK